MDLDNGFDQDYLSGLEERLVEVCTKITKSKEFVASKLVIENNICHKKEPVSDHSTHVFMRFQELLNFDFVDSDELRKLAKSYFSQKIGNWTRAELFLISALLHDLGKVETLVTDDKGETKAPGHEAKSVQIAEIMLRQLGFVGVEIDYVLNVIRVHSGYVLRFLDFINGLSESQIKSAFGSVQLLPEVFLYMIADNENASTFGEYKKMIEERFLQYTEIYQTDDSFKGVDDIGKLVEKILISLKNNSKPWPIETRLFHLSEEVGELHDIYLQYVGAKDREQTIVDIQNALNDVLVETLALYDIFGIDIKSSLEKVIKEDEK